ncbi:Endoplasmic reticulum membrane-associated RNA degradation protein [Halotydeus destructor]|nr:Endoplasmic reticulum membrane-associated RNA degradation protein [Halotydeus destructor]
MRSPDEFDKIRTLESCLSVPVARLLKSSYTDERRNAFCGTLEVDVQLLHEIILQHSDSSESDLHNYAIIVPKMAPYFNDIYLTYSETDLDDLQHLDWLGELKSQLRLVYHDLKNGKSGFPLGLLIVTALVERALGNLVLMRRKFVPPLLKDLLTTPELSELIGESLVKVLLVLIGPPTSLNIRNLLWHSFFVVDEIDERFTFVLIAILNTIGLKLKQDEVIMENLPFRPMTIYVNDGKLSTVFPTLLSQDIDVVHEVIKRSPVILKNSLPIWTLALDLYKRQSWSLCTNVIMCQMENFLRVIYSIFNRMENRLLSAQAQELYTTYSEILSEHLGDSTDKNVFMEFFCLPHIELLMDVLFNPDGLRLRDRLSHGQVSLLAMDDFVVNHVLCVTFCLLRFVELNIHAEATVLTTNLSDIYERSLSYRSIYHINSSLRTSLLNSSLKLVRGQELFAVETCDNSLLDSLNCEYLDSMRIPTLFRTKAEFSFMTLLKQISEVTELSIDSLIDTHIEKVELLRNRQLRSRQRSNLEKLESCQMNLLTSLAKNVICLTELFKEALVREVDTDDNLIKALKKLLQYTQNFLSSCRENRWECSEKYSDLMESMILKINHTRI